MRAVRPEVKEEEGDDDGVLDAIGDEGEGGRADLRHALALYHRPVKAELCCAIETENGAWT